LINNIHLKEKIRHAELVSASDKLVDPEINFGSIYD
jgi:hypothetical protein